MLMWYMPMNCLICFLSGFHDVADLWFNGDVNTLSGRLYETEPFRTLLSHTKSMNEIDRQSCLG
jgi:hypothetical protein